MPTSRNMSIWPMIDGLCSLLYQAVAKTWCQNRAIFSSSGRLEFIIRHTHRPAHNWTASLYDNSML